MQQESRHSRLLVPPRAPQRLVQESHRWRLLVLPKLIRQLEESQYCFLLAPPRCFSECCRSPPFWGAAAAFEAASAIAARVTPLAAAGVSKGTSTTAATVVVGGCWCFRGRLSDYCKSLVFGGCWCFQSRLGNCRRSHVTRGCWCFFLVPPRPPRQLLQESHHSRLRVSSWQVLVPPRPLRQLLQESQNPRQRALPRAPQRLLQERRRWRLLALPRAPQRLLHESFLVADGASEAASATAAEVTSLEAAGAFERA